MSTRVAAMALFTCFFASGGLGASDKSLEFNVRLCEGLEVMPQWGDKARESWDDCETPLTQVPVKVWAGDSERGPISSDETGVVEFEPVVVSSDARVRIGVACTTHHCLTLKMKASDLAEGKNYLIWRSPKLEKPSRDAETDNKPLEQTVGLSAACCSGPLR